MVALAQQLILHVSAKMLVLRQLQTFLDDRSMLGLRPHVADDGVHARTRTRSPRSFDDDSESAAKPRCSSSSAGPKIESLPCSALTREAI
jgi:hypothetical protein